MDETTGLPYFHQTCQELYFVGQFIDDHKQLFQSKPFEGNVRRISISWQWKDQGWGNQKGQLTFKVIRDGNEMISSDTSTIAEHSWSTQRYIYEVDSQLLNSSQQGDIFEIWYLVGGGGGHQLYIRDMKIEIEYDAYVLK